ncbi:hypothetical protein [Tetragenococcus halophilus]|uniref:hypothetical protein n=1 Tax=Tetragenococcus halophilus TaxID=51669 RepID=UPI0025630597|nr:hypothetical protein [Tetragenococcus halophilus]GMG67015.1 hypothetical protein TEHIT2_22060 [Tetragenococcus halophilus]
MELMKKKQVVRRIQRELGTDFDISQTLKDKYYTEKEYQSLKIAIVQLATKYVVKKFSTSKGE